MPTDIKVNYDDYIGVTFKSPYGGVYKIQSLLSKGGEGGVFTIEGNSTIVAKIYSSSILSDANARATKREKLNVMLAHPVNATRTQNGNLLIAWPLDILLSNGAFFGYIMPKVNSKHVLNSVTNQTLCHKHFPKFTWKTKVLLAHNLAYSVRLIHEAGHVIGDMNPLNFLVNDDGVITVIDTDSFSIYDPATNKVFPCEVGVEDYLAPELQKAGKIDGRKFSQESDCFALAISIFRLLMGGYHPFTCKLGAAGGSLSQTPIQTYIAEGKCPYVSNKDSDKALLPSGAPSLDILPKALADLFRNAFTYTASSAKSVMFLRPKPEVWQRTLKKLYDDDNSFKECKARASTEGVHVYYSALTECPWCKLANDLSVANQNLAKNVALISPTPHKQATYNNTTGTAYATGGTPVYQPPTFQQSTYNSAIPFWIVMVAAGFFSGILLRNFFSERILDGWFDIDMSTGWTGFLLALVGAGVCAVASYFLQDYYEDSDSPWLWYLLVLAVPLAVLVAGVAIAVAIYILIIVIVLGIIGALLGGV